MKNLFFGLVLATVTLGVVDHFNMMTAETDTFNQALTEVVEGNVDTHELVNTMFTNKAPF